MSMLPNYYDYLQINAGKEAGDVSAAFQKERYHKHNRNQRGKRSSPCGKGTCLIIFCTVCKHRNTIKKHSRTKENPDTELEVSVNGKADLNTMLNILKVGEQLIAKLEELLKGAKYEAWL